MKSKTSYMQNVYIFLFLIVFFCKSFSIENSSLIKNFKGQISFDTVSAVNLNTLNAQETLDYTWYIRSTIDYQLDVLYKYNNASFLQFYDSLRFRYMWGAKTDTLLLHRKAYIINNYLDVADVGVNKHLLWMREAWIKFGTCLNHQQHFFQLGLIPFEVGRGISLGAAYDISGFLGFSSDFAIDQYAPAGLLHISIIPEKYDTNFYGAILNTRTCFREHDQICHHTQELQGCSKNSSMQCSYLLAWNHKIHYEKTIIVDIEPYVVHLSSPNQKFEFMYDSDVSLSTFGCAFEGIYNKFSWGFEGAINFGEIFLKPWDRNTLKYEINDNGIIVSYYTKVYDQDPLKNVASNAYATFDNDIFVYSSPKTVKQNCLSIGPNLYNAHDRFRPAQRKRLDGFFVVADAEYEFLPKKVSLAFGVGYASGNFDHLIDTNCASTHQCMNQAFSGFIPLQSEYVGKRIRHVVFFNQGIPRCNGVDKNLRSKMNLTNNIETETFINMTNVAFVGGRVIVKPSFFTEHNLELSYNAVAYTIPESKYVDLQNKSVSLARDFLGVELSSEFSCTMWKKLKCEGYLGCFIPGSFYKDKYHTQFSYIDCKSGSDLGFIFNFMINYAF